MKNESKQIRILLLIMLLLFSIVFYLSQESPVPIIKEASVDLRSIDFSKGTVMYLQGEWEFFWQDREQGFLVTVPSIWNHYTDPISNKNFPSKGYASYKLNIALPEDTIIHLKALDMSSAYRISINHEVIAESGVFSSDPSDYKPGYQGVAAYFIVEKEWSELLVEVANFDHRKGGFWSPVIIGTNEALLTYSNQVMIKELLTTGFLFAVAFIYLIFYYFFKKEKGFLFLAVFILLMAVRMIVTNNRYIYTLFPDMSWHWLIRIEYLSYYLAVPVFLLFLRSYLSAFIYHRKICPPCYFYVINAALVVITPVYFFTGLLTIVNIVTVLLSIFILYRLFSMANKHKHQGFEIAIGAFAFFIFVFIDIYSVQTKGYDSQAFFLGIMVFVVANIFSLNRYFSENIERIIDSEQKKTKELHEVTEIKDHFEKKAIVLEEEVNKDHLTGLYNRKFINDNISSLIGLKQNNPMITFTLGMFDLDLFKTVNDTYGHQKGDDILKIVASLMVQKTRPIDIVSRYGGEEFLILFVNIGQDQVEQIAERIREAIEKEVAIQTGIYITISGGIIEAADESADELIKKADELLYKAKQGGRNRIEKSMHKNLDD